jgi:DNA ligase 1
VPAPFNLLQQRIARKTLTRRCWPSAGALHRLRPAGAGRADLRGQPQQERRAALEACWLLPGRRSALPPVAAVPGAEDWAGLAACARSRARGASRA